VILTRSIDQISSFYSVGSEVVVVEFSAFPSLIDEGGRLELILENNIVDEVVYDEGIHFDLLNDTRGISLEKINPFLPSIEESSWYSASTNEHATPGRENSQLISNNAQGEVNIASKVIFPNNDGYKDFLEVNYSLRDNAVGNGYIYDIEGREIIHFLRNELLDSEGVIVWDALNDEQELVSSGVYILLLETVSNDGGVNTYKLPFTVVEN